MTPGGTVVGRCRAAILGGLLALGGCAGLAPHGPPLTSAPVELDQTPFFPQKVNQCGPAALATVLTASGVPAEPDALSPALYIPDRQGTLQVELAAAARRHGRLAVQTGGSLETLVGQLRQGRPVLVLQNLAVSFYPVWHYAVVVGYLPEQDAFVLRSGTERRRVTRRGRFEATWRRADYWGLVLLAPGDAPQGLEPRAYLGAAADLENTGDYRDALAAFRAAVAVWPEEPMARLGEANNLYYLDRREEAAAAYRTLLAHHPGQTVAVHNLVMLLIELGRPCEARGVLADAAGLTGALMETARRAAAEATASACSAG